jgi:hypothetical protein
MSLLPKNGLSEYAKKLDLLLYGATIFSPMKYASFKLLYRK